MRYEHNSDGTARAIRVGLARIDSTQGALAEHLEFSQPAIHRRMSGKVPWRIDELAKVANYLGVPLAELLGDSTKASA